MSKENAREGSLVTGETKVNLLGQSLRDPLKRGNAVELFRDLTPQIVKGISEGDSSAVAPVMNLLDPNMLGIENKAETVSDPLYLQGRLDALLDVAKVASGRMISDAIRKTPRERVASFLRHIAHPVKVFPI